MAEILDRLGNDNQLGKILFELLNEIATSAIVKANPNDKKDAVSPLSEDRASRTCKSVPVSPKEHITALKLSKSDDESEKAQTNSANHDVDPALGRPRYQWQATAARATQERRTMSSTELKKLYSVYVGHLPCDITEDELIDLFKDIGEVIDAFVFPAVSGKTYTYGFVRFLTLDEAKDAVTEKHLKVIGNMQIHVELSSETRRKVQPKDDDDDGESSQLLRKDYPKVVRRSVDDNDEKKVIGKIKSSLCKIKGTDSPGFGGCSSEDVFKNLVTILKMIINFPMSLADASADEGKGPPGTTKKNSVNGHQPQSFANNTESLTAVGQRPVTPTFPITSRLPSSIDKTNTREIDDEYVGKRDALSFSYPERLSSMPVRNVVEQECPSPELLNSALIDKVRDFLEPRSADDVSSPHDLPSVNASKPCSSLAANPCEGQAGKIVNEKSSSSVILQGRPAELDLDNDFHMLRSYKRSSIKPDVKVPERPETSSVPCNQQSDGFPTPVLDQYNHFYSLPSMNQTNSSPTIERLSVEEPMKTSSNMTENNNYGHNKESAAKTASSNGHAWEDVEDVSAAISSPVYSDDGLSLKSSQSSNCSVTSNLTKSDLSGRSSDESSHSLNHHTAVANGLSDNSDLSPASDNDSANVTKSRAVRTSSAHSKSSSDCSVVLKDVSPPSDHESEDATKGRVLLSSAPLKTSSPDSSAFLKDVRPVSDHESLNLSNYGVVKLSNVPSKTSERTGYPQTFCTTFRHDDISPPYKLFGINNGHIDSPMLNIIHANTDVKTSSVCDVEPALIGQGKPTRILPPSIPFPSDDIGSNKVKNVVEISPIGYERGTKAAGTDGPVKSPGRRERTLAPFFSKLFTDRNGCDSHSASKSLKTSPLLKKCDGSISNLYSRPQMIANILSSDSAKVEATQMMMNDAAILGVSKREYDKPYCDVTSVDSGIGCESSPDFQSVSKTYVAGSTNEESDDAEIVKLKESLKGQESRLQELQKSLAGYPRRKRDKFRRRFDDDTNFELETRIHDAEVLLQKKNEIWTSRSSEQELAYEREKLQSVDDTELLKQLAIEMQKEYLTNEGCVTELKCTILELKMKLLLEENS